MTDTFSQKCCIYSSLCCPMLSCLCLCSGCQMRVLFRNVRVRILYEKIKLSFHYFSCNSFILSFSFYVSNNSKNIIILKKLVKSVESFSSFREIVEQQFVLIFICTVDVLLISDCASVSSRINEGRNFSSLFYFTSFWKWKRKILFIRSEHNNSINFSPIETRTGKIWHT